VSAMPLQPLERTAYRTGILPANKETLTLELGRMGSHAARAFFAENRHDDTSRRT
jgi:hypothetical protein